MRLPAPRLGAGAQRDAAVADHDRGGPAFVQPVRLQDAAVIEVNRHRFQTLLPGQDDPPPLPWLNRLVCQNPGLAIGRPCQGRDHRLAAKVTKENGTRVLIGDGRSRIWLRIYGGTVREQPASNNKQPGHTVGFVRIAHRVVRRAGC